MAPAGNSNAAEEELSTPNAIADRPATWRRLGRDVGEMTLRPGSPSPKRVSQLPMRLRNARAKLLVQGGEKSDRQRQTKSLVRDRKRHAPPAAVECLVWSGKRLPSSGSGIK